MPKITTYRANHSTDCIDIAGATRYLGRQSVSFALKKELLEMLRIFRGCATCSKVIHRGKLLKKKKQQDFVYGHGRIPTKGVVEIEVVPQIQKTNDESIPPFLEHACNDIVFENILQELKSPVVRFNVVFR